MLVHSDTNPDSELISLCPFFLMLHAQWRSNKYEYYSLVPIKTVDLDLVCNFHIFQFPWFFTDLVFTFHIFQFPWFFTDLVFTFHIFQFPWFFDTFCCIYFSGCLYCSPQSSCQRKDGRLESQNRTETWEKVSLCDLGKSEFMCIGKM